MDCFTAIDAPAVLDKLETHLAYLESLNLGTRLVPRIKRDVGELVGNLRSAVSGRKQFFHNDGLVLLEFFNPATEDASDVSWVVHEMEQYWIDRGRQSEVSKLEAELATYKTRSILDRKQTLEKYWTSHMLDLTHAAKFALDLRNLLVTEASVERSFVNQTRVYSPLRSGLSGETMNALMILKDGNAPTDDRQDTPKQATSNVISFHEWQVLTVTMSEPLAKMQTRFADKRQQAETLEPGNRVSVEWEDPVTKVGVWYNGMLVSKEGNCVYNIVYDQEKTKVRKFQPLDRDSRWRLLTNNAAE